MAVGKDDDVGLRRVHQQVGDIDEAFEGREQLQIDLHELARNSGARVRRAPGRE